MTLFAKDRDETISAWDAIPGKCYECLECQTPLKLRHSKKKFPHFYHLTTARSCRLYSKSDKHLLIQYEIQRNLPGAILEKPFSAIQRIADVVWNDIVFEIQCSSMSQKEAESRVNEYRTLGYEVVWILSDHRFNRRRVSAAEDWMRKHWCYFVDKNLVFYDQLEIIQKQRRIQRGRKLPIRLKAMRAPAQHRNKFYFENDVLDLTLREKIELLPKHTMCIKAYFQRHIKAAYVALLNSLLKIDCRS